MTDIGLAVLRLALAIVFMAHGMNKLFGLFGGPNVGPGGLTATAEYLTRIGLGPAMAVAVVAGVVQLAGGILLGAGLLTRWASAAVLGYVVIGIWKEHARWGFFLNWAGEHGRGNGIEYSVILAGALVCLILAGGGRWSLDGRRAADAESRALGRARLRNR
jgi:putative oxidoreductase